jgi:hypothetical protein
MNLQTVDHQGKTLSMAEYAAELARNGTRILSGTRGSIWAGHEPGAMVRMPTFHLLPPTPSEVRQVLWRGRAAVLSYILEPNESHPANAYLYVCMDQMYALEKLPREMRRNARRGSNHLRIAPITAEQLLAHGAQAFCDTRRRVGLNDGTTEQFRRRFGLRVRCQGHVFLGAWKDDILAAFLSITEVDDWAEIEGTFSRDSLLGLKPNDALLFYVLSNYLAGGKCRIVSYGLSSIQTKTNEAGLYAFKTKVGFEAKRVHRVFVVHPLLRPLVGRVTLGSLKLLLRLFPRQRLLKKADGMIESVVDSTRHG